MNTDHIHALFTRVNDDPDLQARFKAITTEADFNALVAELDYDVTYADVASTTDDTELTESELADVAGGSFLIPPLPDVRNLEPGTTNPGNNNTRW